MFPAEPSAPVAHHQLAPAARAPASPITAPPRSFCWTLTWLLATFLTLQTGSLPPRPLTLFRTPVVRRRRSAMPPGR